MAYEPPTLPAPYTPEQEKEYRRQFVNKRRWRVVFIVLATLLAAVQVFNADEHSELPLLLLWLVPMLLIWFIWRCPGCGKGFRTNPEVCSACGLRLK